MVQGGLGEGSLDEARPRPPFGGGFASRRRPLAQAPALYRDAPVSIADVFPSSWTDLLPGAWFLLLAGGLVWLLRRFYEPLPWKLVAALLLPHLIFFGPFLFGGKLLLPLDSLRGEVPFALLEPAEPHANPIEGDLLQLVAPAIAETRRALFALELPLWNRQAGTGLPLLADPQAQVLQPLVLAALPFGVATGAAVTAALRVWMALVFMLLFLRRQGLAEGASLFGALAWGFGSFLMLWLGWPMANSAAWLPSVLYGLARVIDLGGRRDEALAALALFGLLLGGHPETLLYCLGLAGVFVCSRLWPLGREGFCARLPRLLATAAVAAALAAPAVIPAIDHLPTTLRASRLGEPVAPVAETALRRAELRLLPVVAPNVFGNNRYNAYWGPANINEDSTGFVGTVTLLLALLALLPGARRRPQEVAWGLCGAVALGVVAQAPGIVDLLRVLPGGSVSGFHHRLLLPLGFALVMVASAELDRRLGGERPRLPVAFTALFLAGLLAWAYLAHSNPADPASLAPLRLGWLTWQLRLLALAAVLLLVGRPRRLLPWVLSALLVFELLLLARPAHPPAPRRLDFPTTPSLDFLRQHAGDLRVAAVGLGLSPNLAGIYGLTDLRVYNPAAPAAALEAMAPLITDWSGEVPLLCAFDHPLYARLGVRLLLTPTATELPEPWRRVFSDPSGAVWEQPLARPLVELVDEHGASTPELKIETAGNGRWRGTYSAPLPRRLSTSLFQDGGWRVKVDGRTLLPMAADGPWIAAELPAGQHRLELIYRPWSFTIGCVVEMIGLGFAAWRWRRYRPRISASI